MASSDATSSYSKWYLTKTQKLQFGISQLAARFELDYKCDYEYPFVAQSESGDIYKGSIRGLIVSANPKDVDDEHLMPRPVRIKLFCKKLAQFLVDELDDDPTASIHVGAGKSFIDHHLVQASNANAIYDALIARMHQGNPSLISNTLKLQVVIYWKPEEQMDESVEFDENGDIPWHKTNFTPLKMVDTALQKIADSGDDFGFNISFHSQFAELGNDREIVALLNVAEGDDHIAPLKVRILSFSKMAAAQFVDIIDFQKAEVVIAVAPSSHTVTDSNDFAQQLSKHLLEYLVNGQNRSSFTFRLNFQ